MDEKLKVKLHILKKAKEQLSKASDDWDDDYGDGHQDYGDGQDEDLQGLSVYDSADDMEGDAADQFLQEQDGQPEKANIQDNPESDDPGLETKTQRPGRWKSNSANYTDDHKSKIEELMADGYSDREAERMAGAHSGPGNYFEALNSKGRDVPEMSDRFINELKGHANDFVKRSRRHAEQNAEKSKNPVRYTRGQMDKEFSNHAEDYLKGHNDLVNSDEYKNMSMRDKWAAKHDYENKYHEENPDHRSNFHGLTPKGVHKMDANVAYNKNLHDHLSSLLGHGDGGKAMSGREAAEHLGMQADERGGGSNISTFSDPSQKFAEENKPHIENRIKDLQGKIKDDSISQRLSELATLKGPQKQISQQNKSGDPEHEKKQNLMNHFLTEHSPVVHRAISALKAKGMVNDSTDLDSLTSGPALFGLSNALSRYNKGGGAKFSTFALPHVYGAMKEELSNQDPVGSSARSNVNAQKKKTAIKGDV